jgi:photosynthetic reaction center H subunit
MRGLPAFAFSAGKDPRGLAVRGADDAVAGKVVDMWVDAPEAMVRYLEVDLGAGDTRLIPMPMAKIGWKGVIVRSIRSDQFAGVPKIASDREITKLEEEKVCAYYAGGTLYATQERVDSQLDPLTA